MGLCGAEWVHGGVVAIGKGGERRKCICLRCGGEWEMPDSPDKLMLGITYNMSRQESSILGKRKSKHVGTPRREKMRSKLFLDLWAGLIPCCLYIMYMALNY